MPMSDEPPPEVSPSFWLAICAVLAIPLAKAAAPAATPAATPQGPISEKDLIIFWTVASVEIQVSPYASAFDHLNDFSAASLLVSTLFWA